MSVAQSQLLVDGVFEGGGVKGIGLVGALEVVEAAGYKFVNVAGTSAGAIVATLLAAGYTAAELKPIIMGFDFRRFIDPDWVGRIPLAGLAIDEIVKNGLCKGDYFEGLMREYLSAKGKRTFADLRLDTTESLLAQRFSASAEDPRFRCKVQVVAADVTRGRMLVLPGGIADYGLEPDELDIARAVRMSMSIPFLFMPVRLPASGPGATRAEECCIVDGGLLSNFPIELFDVEGIPPWPTFGFKLVTADDAHLAGVVRHPIHGPLDELVAMFFTAMEAHDAYYLDASKFVRTIAIDTLGVAATDFNLSQGQKDALYESGRAAAQTFLAHWNFDEYVRTYRSGRPIPTRRQSVMPTATESATAVKVAPTPHRRGIDL